jgi:hypothetical protein
LSAPEPLPQVQPRYVYLFALDATGGITLIVPGPGMAVGENLVPDSRQRGPTETLIPLGNGFEVTPPFGTDTLVLLTSAVALPDPSVLEIEPVHHGVKLRRPCMKAIECLIFGLSEDDIRAPQNPAPTNWSIERLILESVDR